MGVPTDQKHYSKLVLGVENKVSGDVLSRKYLGPQNKKRRKKKKEKRRKESMVKKSLHIQYVHCNFTSYCPSHSFLTLW